METFLLRYSTVVWYAQTQLFHCERSNPEIGCLGRKLQVILFLWAVPLDNNTSMK